MGDIFERFFNDTQPKSDRLLARWVGTRRFSAPARQNLTRLACVRFAGWKTGDTAGWKTCATLTRSAPVFRACSLKSNAFGLRTVCRLENRRYGRLENLRYDNALRAEYLWNLTWSN